MMKINISVRSVAKRTSTRSVQALATGSMGDYKDCFGGMIEDLQRGFGAMGYSD